MVTQRPDFTTLARCLIRGRGDLVGIGQPLPQIDVHEPRQLFSTETEDRHVDVECLECAEFDGQQFKIPV
jgi:hypothetical protein